MSAGNAQSGDSFSPDNAPFELRLLGPFALTHRASDTSISVTAAKMRALLAFLCASPGFTEKRRRIAGLLWASSEDDQARQSLRQLLSQFRRAEEGCAAVLLTYDDEAISLNIDCVAIDCALLTKAHSSTDIATLRKAANAYRSEFGSGLETGESEFDERLEGERTRCREAIISILDRLVRLLAAAGQHREALERANRLLEIEPFREETHRLVIQQEEIVSGRASALARFQSFKKILQDDIGVPPEQATLDLVEKLRTSAETRAAQPQFQPPMVEGEPLQPIKAIQAVIAPKLRRFPVVAASLVASLLVGTVSGWQMLRAPVAYVGENVGRVSVAILPFQFATDREDLRARNRDLEADTRLAFSRAIRLAPVEIREGMAARDAVSVGRALGARYVVKSTLSEALGAMQAEVTLFDSASGVSVAATAVPVDGMTIKFARELSRFVYHEIVLSRARSLSEAEPDSTAALLWKAEAARIRTRVGLVDPEEIRLIETVLAREPNQLYALQGLASTLILRVAREQSPDRATDIARATDLVRRAREQAPSSTEIGFQEGMLNKLQGKFEAAEHNFERAFRLDRTHFNAAAQAAHVKIFMGRFEEGFDEMEAATAYLLPDMAAAEVAYIAGETALVAGRPDRAVAYFDMAIAGNATIARIHGMRAAALWVAGRTDEARNAARQSQKLEPPYSPELMAQRGRATATPRFKEARDRYVAAYRAALAPASASTN